MRTDKSLGTSSSLTEALSELCVCHMYFVKSLCPWHWTSGGLHVVTVVRMLNSLKIKLFKCTESSEVAWFYMCYFTDAFFFLAAKKKEKKSKTNEKKESHSGKNQLDSGQKPTPPAVVPREDSAVKKSSEPARKPVEEKHEDGNSSVPPPEPKQTPASGARKTGKQTAQPVQLPPSQPPSSGPLKKEAPKVTASEPKKKQPPQPEIGKWDCLSSICLNRESR